MTFETMGSSQPLLYTRVRKGETQPSPSQAKSVSVILQGKDSTVVAQTGTAKMAGSALPILELLAKGERAGGKQVRALVLTPARELDEFERGLCRCDRCVIVFVQRYGSITRRGDQIRYHRDLRCAEARVVYR